MKYTRYTRPNCREMIKVIMEAGCERRGERMKMVER